MASLILLALLFASLAQSQPSPVDEPLPANAWMRTPIPWEPSSDTVPSMLRVSRDNYFDQLIGFSVPLTPSLAKSRNLSSGSTFGPQQEIPAVPNRTIVTAQFVEYRPIWTLSRRSLYTEVTLRVADIFEDATHSIKPNERITVILNGGTVALPGGEVLSYLVAPTKFSLIPGRSYLLVLTHYPNGQFFRTIREWDISDGTARPNFGFAPKDELLNGLETDQLRSALQAQIGTNP